MKDKIFFSVSKIETAYLILFILAALPFFILTFYSHPSEVEDFFYMDRMENIGFMKASKSLYNLWSGRFFAHSISLLIYFFAKTDFYYKIFTLFFMIAFISAIFLLIKNIFKKNISIKESLLFTFAIFFLYVYALPTVSQGFYWLISVPVYNNSIILLLLFLICYSGLYRSQRLQSKILYAVLCSLIAFCIGGSNEIALISLVLLMGLFLIFNFRMLNWYLVFVSIFMFLGSYINYFSPGTQIRHLNFPENHDLSFSIYNSIAYVFENVFTWIFISPIIPVTIILFPLLYKSIVKPDSKPDIFQLSPLYSIFISLVILIAGSFVFFWSTGIQPYPRSLNLIYFLFLILWFYNVINLTKYIRFKYNRTFEKIPLYLFGVSFLFIVFFLSLENNVIKAYEDLLSGTAEKYDNELNERYEFIINCKSDTVYLEKLNTNPSSTRIFLISSDTEKIFNIWLANHFKKKSIVLKNEDKHQLPK